MFIIVPSSISVLPYRTTNEFLVNKINKLYFVKSARFLTTTTLLRRDGKGQSAKLYFVLVDLQVWSNGVITILCPSPSLYHYHNLFTELRTIANTTIKVPFLYHPTHPPLACSNWIKYWKKAKWAWFIVKTDWADFSLSVLFLVNIWIVLTCLSTPSPNALSGWEDTFNKPLPLLAGRNCVWRKTVPTWTVWPSGLKEVSMFNRIFGVNTKIN